MIFSKLSRSWKYPNLEKVTFTRLQNSYHLNTACPAEMTSHTSVTIIGLSLYSARLQKPVIAYRMT